MARPRTREERLFGAAVMRRSFALRGEEQARAFRSVYDGVLRDLGLTDDEVLRFLEANGAAVDEAIGRGRA